MLTPLRRAAEAARQEVGRIQIAFPEALCLIGRGEYQRALTLLLDVLATCERIGEKVWYARHLNGAGWLYGELQDARGAMDWNRRSLAAALETNVPDPECESNARLNLGDNLLALGQPDAAAEQFRIVERIVRHPRPTDHWMLWSYAQHLLHSFGELWLVRGDAQTALAYADECVQRAEATGRRKYVVKGRRLRGQAHLARGNLDAAEQELTAALLVATELGNPPQRWKTHAAIGDLHAARGRPDDARRAYRAALAVVDRVAAGLTDESVRSLRTTFLELAARPIDPRRSGNGGLSQDRKPRRAPQGGADSTDEVLVAGRQHVGRLRRRTRTHGAAHRGQASTGLDGTARCAGGSAAAACRSRQCPVRPRGVVVGDVLAQVRPRVALVERDEVVETVAPEDADHALGHGGRLRRPPGDVSSVRAALRSRRLLCRTPTLCGAQPPMNSKFRTSLPWRRSSAR